jgi:hypothetical protein
MQILDVPGLRSTTDAFKRGLWELAARHGWNVDAIAAIISRESGFKPSAKSPFGTASGLLQWIDRTAQLMGTTAAALRQMSAEEQLPYVEKYYRMMGAHAGWRPVDYYLAGWGTGIGKPNDYVLASKTDPKKYNGGTKNLYDLNASLDADGDGHITVNDVAEVLERVMHAAGGRYLPLPLPSPSADSVVSPSPSSSSTTSAVDDLERIKCDIERVVENLKKDENA